MNLHINEDVAETDSPSPATVANTKMGVSFNTSLYTQLKFILDMVNMLCSKGCIHMLFFWTFREDFLHEII